MKHDMRDPYVDERPLRRRETLTSALFPCSFLQADYTGIKLTPSEIEEIVTASRRCVCLRSLFGLEGLSPSVEMSLLMETGICRVNGLTALTLTLTLTLIGICRVNGLTADRWEFGRLSEVSV
jgi:hypothetical protein